MSDELTLDANAVQEFRAARLQANLERIRASLTGQSADLLSYEDVRDKVRAIETNRRELKDIPLDAIVGSVGRYTDFTRSFFPRQEGNEQRWTRVRMRVESLQGLPPIEVYQLGDVYFVIDGNHRVSVARSLEANFIEAYVTRVETSVPLTTHVDPDDLIIAERYARFLEKTEIHDALPQSDFTMSAAGNYRILERQILLHQEWMGGKTTFKDAAVDWYHHVYFPVVQIVRRRGMLRDFPDRTETDLFVWIQKHRNTLADLLGWCLDPDVAAADLVEKFSQTAQKRLQRASQRFLDAVTPDALEAGPMPGEWRKIWLETHQDERLFRHILVGINGQADGWNALDWALIIAQREGSRLYGLHVTDKDQSPAIDAVQSGFDQHTRQSDVVAELRIKQGNIARSLCDSARWMDLVVVSLAHPPGPQPINRLSSGFSQLLRRSPRPVLAVPQASQTLRRFLIAFDDSDRSWEAMFIAAYLAKQWSIPMTVVSVVEADSRKGVIRRAQEYLEKKAISSDYQEVSGKPAPEIMRIANECRCDLILMGSYGHNPVMEIAFGSTVDEILRVFKGAVMVCR